MANKPSAEELKKNLSEMQFYVTQNHGTEPPFTGRLLHNKRDGVYHCLICDAPLFHSQTKYDSGCGWPSFYEPVSEESIRYIKDLSHGMQRIEIRCGNCDAHLGHVFPDGPQPTGERYCVNSASYALPMAKTAKKSTVEKTIQQLIPQERKIMNLDDIINSMTLEVYQRLSTAVELGKWPDGVALTVEQKENCLQLVMLWQARNNTEAQHMTIDTNGQMVMKSKQQLKEDFGISAKAIAMFK
ncbi:methionine sulfoxide reductase B [Escherichia coli]|uniref:Peptide methionine sulfoxide reductase MsrB n=13 Tax=Pseudomonadota TaxID=1224 RepID=A0A376S900_ECOLX|nr:methionine sulfoxide reductase B [Escherichia coli]